MMPRSTYDLVLIMGEGYQISTSSTTKYTSVDRFSHNISIDISPINIKCNFSDYNI
jgi:hypothetical protein